MDPGPLYEVKPGIKSINRNSFHWSKIFTNHQSRFFSQKPVKVSVRLFGKVEYYSIFLPIVIDQLDGVVGITEAKTSLDFHAKFS